jgi:hypothetical protein
MFLFIPRNNRNNIPIILIANVYFVNSNISYKRLYVFDVASTYLQHAVHRLLH